MNLSAIAIDDEAYALKVLDSFSNKVKFIDLKGLFTDPFEAFEFLSKNEIDIIFLDINMPDISGIEFVRRLQCSPMIIFTTAYSEHAVQSYDLGVVDYLLKPISFERFETACNRVVKLKFSSEKEKPSNELFIKSGYQTVKLDLDQVVYVESCGNYMSFMMLDGKRVMSRSNMSETLKILPKEDFTQVHRSYIISKSKVESLDKHNIYLKNNVIPIGTSFKVQL
jgi:two-component system LytT family response regulator